jgi:Rrf2 family protein
MAASISDNLHPLYIGCYVSAMRINEGVEWAAHACALLALLPEGKALSAVALAEFHELPRAYMAKHMQALARAGVVKSVRGASGGYRLARAASEISLWDVRSAIEGPGPDFRCQEIRRNGPCPSHDIGKPCTIARAFWAAEQAYQAQARTVSIASIVTSIGAGASPARRERFAAWMAANT